MITKKIKINDIQLSKYFYLEYDTETFDIISMKEIHDESIPQCVIVPIELLYGKFYIISDHNNSIVILLYLTLDNKVIFLSQHDVEKLTYENFTSKLINKKIITREEILTHIDFIKL